MIFLIGSSIEALYQTHKRKGEVDALMIALAGVVILAIIVLAFVLVVGNSLDEGKSMICEKIADEEESAIGTAVSLFDRFGGC